jgi:plasmid maintenance system antidote protein VapI
MGRAGRPISSQTKLADELRRRGWTAKEAGEALGVPPRTINRWVRGETLTPDWVWVSLKNIDRLEAIRKAARG